MGRDKSMQTKTAEYSGRQALFILAVVVLGVSLRALTALRGHNFDVESYKIVAGIMAAGGNVYAETERYNYGPIWFHLLHFLDMIPMFEGLGANAIRMKVAGLLTIVDVCIFLFLLRQYSLKIAALFLLNPVSIIITGYHSQFDNLAVLLGLLSVASYRAEGSLPSRLACLVGIGISLSVKHILFVFPFWLAFKERSLYRQILVLAVPYLVFALGFVFYLPEGLQGMMANVFLYKSFANAPFWAVFLPAIFFAYIPKIILFVGALMLAGLFVKAKSPLESLHIYLISLIVFSSAIANQYLSIPVPSATVFWNWGYALYSLAGGIFLTVEGNGLHSETVRNLIGWHGELGYYLLIALLAFGLSITLFGQDKLKAFSLRFLKGTAHLLLRALPGR